MTELLAPYTDEHGTKWYPVRHALGGVVCSLTPESQEAWQELADRQHQRLIDMIERRKSRRSVCLRT